MARRRHPCLFLHGLGQHGRVWDDVVPFVPAGHRVLALDHRGHGRSGWSADERYGIDALVGDVAIRVAAKRRVRGIVVVEAGPELKRNGLRRVVANEHDVSRTYATVED